MASRSNFQRLVVGGAITALTLLLVLWLVDLNQLARAITQIPVHAWFAVAATSLIALILRWIRLGLASGGTASLPLLKATALYLAATSILPGKVGELALPLALMRIARLDMAHAVGLLVVLRIYDVMSLTVLGVIAMAMLGRTIDPLLLILGCLCALGLLVLPQMARILSASLLPQLHLRPRLHAFAEKFTSAAAALSPGRSISVALLSFGIWLCILAGSFVSTRAVGLDTSFVDASAAAIAASFAFALPVAGIANVGPFEAAYAGVLVALGYSTEPALAAALLLHFGATALAVTAGLVAQFTAISASIRTERGMR